MHEKAKIIITQIREETFCNNTIDLRECNLTDQDINSLMQAIDNKPRIGEMVRALRLDDNPYVTAITISDNLKNLKEFSVYNNPNLVKLNIPQEIYYSGMKFIPISDAKRPLVINAKIAKLIEKIKNNTFIETNIEIELDDIFLNEYDISELMNALQENPLAASSIIAIRISFLLMQNEIHLPTTLINLQNLEVINCQNLTYIELPRTLTNIENIHILNTNIHILGISNSFKKLSNLMLSNNKNLNYIIIPNTIESLVNVECTDCPKLFLILLPNNCPLLQDITVTGTSVKAFKFPHPLPALSAISIYRKNSLTSISKMELNKCIEDRILYLESGYNFARAEIAQFNQIEANPHLLKEHFEILLEQFKAVIKTNIGAFFAYSYLLHGTTGKPGLPNDILRLLEGFIPGNIFGYAIPNKLINDEIERLTGVLPEKQQSALIDFTKSEDFKRILEQDNEHITSESNKFIAAKCDITPIAEPIVEKRVRRDLSTLLAFKKYCTTKAEERFAMYHVLHGETSKTYFKENVNIFRNIGL